MGNCNRKQIDPVEEYENALVDLLKMIKLNLNSIEDKIEKVKKEDVHYRMKKLIFWLNVLKQINPYIRLLEDNNTNKNLNLEKIKNDFDEIFMNLWTNDRNKFYKNIDNLKESIKPSTNSPDCNHDQLGKERLSKIPSILNENSTTTPK